MKLTIPKILITIICTCILLNLQAEELFIGGTLKSHSSDEVEICLDQLNIVMNDSKKFKVKTDENGNFSFSTKKLRYGSYYNWIQAGDAKIYFTITPGDSVIINYDSEGVDSVIFMGDYPARNKFINNYYEIVFKRKSPNTMFDEYTCLGLIEGYYHNDVRLLESYCDEGLDKEFVDYFKNILKITYLYSMSTAIFDYSDIFIEAYEKYTNGQIIEKYDLFYNSSVSAYVRLKYTASTDLYTVKGLKESFYIAESIFNKEFADIYKGYLIGYYFSAINKKKQKQNEGIDEVIGDYYANTPNEIIKSELYELFKEIEYVVVLPTD